MNPGYTLNPDAVSFDFVQNFHEQPSWNAGATDFIPYISPNQPAPHVQPAPAVSSSPSASNPQPPIPSVPSHPSQSLPSILPNPSILAASPNPVPSKPDPKPSEADPSKPFRRVYTYEVLINLRESNKQLPEGVVIPDTYSKTGSRSKGNKKGSQPSKASGQSGIKRAENQLNTLSILVKAEKPFTEKLKKQADEQEIKSREIRSILNKLTDRNFEKLLAELTSFEYDNQLLGNLTNFIFERATAMNFPGLYSKLCSSLRKAFVAKNLSSRFRKSIVEKCRECFYNEDNPVESDKLMEAEFKRRRRLIGNIKFIALLHQVKMIKSEIMFECFEVLLEPKSLSDETLETCITLFKDTCPLLVGDFPDDVRKYYDKVVSLMDSPKFCKRIQFMIQDLIDVKEVIMIPRAVRQPPVKKVENLGNVEKKNETELEVKVEVEVEVEQREEEEKMLEENFKSKIWDLTRVYVSKIMEDDWLESFKEIFNKNKNLYLEIIVQVIKYGLYEYNIDEKMKLVCELNKLLMKELHIDIGVIHKALAIAEKDLYEIIIDNPNAGRMFILITNDFQ